jgi:serine/threonine-protein kinase
MAPEQARGQPVVPQTDLYAAGVILYELLTGTTPHQAEDLGGLLFQIAMEEPEPVTQHRKDLPAELVGCLERMLAREPTDRFESASRARSALLAGVDLEEGAIGEVQRGVFERLRALVDA